MQLRNGASTPETEMTGKTADNAQLRTGNLGPSKQSPQRKK